MREPTRYTLATASVLKTVSPFALAACAELKSRMVDTLRSATSVLRSLTSSTPTVRGEVMAPVTVTSIAFILLATWLVRVFRDATSMLLPMIQTDEETDI